MPELDEVTTGALHWLASEARPSGDGGVGLPSTASIGLTRCPAPISRP